MRRYRYRFFGFWLAVALSLGTGRSALAEVPAGCAAPLPAALSPAQQASNLAFFKRELIRYRCTRYDGDIARVDRAAAAWIARRAPRVSKPALVLDIDETSLSNWPVMVHNDFAYFRGGDCDLAAPRACGQAAWEASEAAPAIAPTLDLFNEAKARGVAVFFVTGRRDSERAITEGNLRKAGYEGWSGLFMRPPQSREAAMEIYKSGARAKIEALGYRIVANVGDQQSDLALGHAERGFKLPNPFYYIP